MSIFVSSESNLNKFKRLLFFFSFILFIYFFIPYTPRFPSVSSLTEHPQAKALRPPEKNIFNFIIGRESRVLFINTEAVKILFAISKEEKRRREGRKQNKNTMQYLRSQQFSISY